MIWSAVLVQTMAWRVMIPKKISTMFSHDPEVGVKCRISRGFLVSQAFTFDLDLVSDDSNAGRLAAYTGGPCCSTTGIRAPRLGRVLGRNRTRMRATSGPFVRWLAEKTIDGGVV